MELQEFIQSRKDRMSDECMPKALRSIHANIKREIKSASGLTVQEKHNALDEMSRHFHNCEGFLK